jgi:hypothetical protein
VLGANLHGRWTSPTTWAQRAPARAVSIESVRVIPAPAGQKVRELSEDLNVPVDYLRSGDQGAPEPLDDLRLWDRFKTLQGLPKDDLESVIKVLDALIAQSQGGSPFTGA